MLVGEKIQKLRKAKHLTQDELGKIIDTDGNTVSRWERNKLGVGSSYIAKLAAALNTTTDYLLNGESPESRESLPINNAPMEVVNENKLGLSYWGGVADNASIVAKRGDPQELSLVAALLRTALGAVEKSDPSSHIKQDARIIGVNGDNQGNKNNVNVSTET